MNKQTFLKLQYSNIDYIERNMKELIFTQQSLKTLPYPFVLNIHYACTAEEKYMD
jgi:hypothetical protein